MNPKPTVIRPADIAPHQSPQAQSLTPCITTNTCGTTTISAGLVTMPASAVSLPHLHAHTDIIVMCIEGYAATLYLGVEPNGDHTWSALYHGPKEFCYIPAGIPHVAVNLSSVHPLTAVETRTDPTFNGDVVLTPELADSALDAVARLVADATHDRSVYRGQWRRTWPWIPPL